MRTKILLATATALAAGMFASNAQVYSANIVGYVNNPNTYNGKFVMIANPLDASSNGGNTLTNLFPGINGGTTVELWNGITFTAYKLTAGTWINQTTLAAANDTPIPPGVGAFVLLGGSKGYTNTFVGQVVGTSGTLVTNLINPGFQLVSSLIPYADYVTNTATLNLVAKGGSVLETWDPNAQAFTAFKFTAGQWVNQTTLSPQTPYINVAQGFFFQPNGTSSNLWVEPFPQ